MKVGIEYLLPGGNDTGVEYAIREAVAAVLERDSPHSFTVFASERSRPLLPQCARAQTSVVTMASPFRAGRILWQQAVAPCLAMRHKLDLYHATGYVASPLFAVPVVVSLYDTIALDNARYTSFSNALYFSSAVPRGLRRAARIIVPTAHVKERLIGLLPATENKIDVLPLGISPRYHVKDPAEIRACLAHIPSLQSRKYILAVGNIEHKKNCLGLLRAFNKVREVLGCEYVLAFAGNPGSASMELRRYIDAHALQDSVQFLDYVDGRDLPFLYGGAQLLVYPSWDEGFGFPPLEAMACGTPVLCSDVPAVTEVCGDAAYLVEPDETESIAGGMLDILTQPSFAQRLVKRGHERAVKYSWGAYANGLLASYEAAFAHRRQTAPINNSVST